MEVKKDILWRVYLSFIGLVIFGIMILGKAFYTQRIEGSYWKKMGDSLHTKIIDMAAERGTIYSEDGSMLSTSIPEFDVYIDFGAEGLRKENGKLFYAKLDSLSMLLSGLFKDKSIADYRQELLTGYQEKYRYYPFRKKVSFEQYKQMRDFALVREGKNKSGFITEVKTRRLNPFGELGFRTIGLYRQNVKLVGLERSFDSVLRGTSGKRLVRFVAGGVMMPVEGYEFAPENGYDIYTTIDVDMQDIAERALMKKMQQGEALEGTCVVMEVATGKIKAIANLGRTSDSTYFETDNYALRTSEPGSTIKLVTLLAGLEDKHVTIQDSIHINGGYWNILGRPVRDDHGGPQYISFKTAFVNSSNVAMSKLAYQYYTPDPASYYKHLKRLHLTQKTGIELKEEFAPLVKNPAKSSYWHPQTLVSWGFGYELQFSPLQILMVYNAVANNGKMMKPYLLNEIRRYGTVVQKNNPQVLEATIASPATIQQLQECLAAVCAEGTARRAFETALYKAAGKTGTAKVNDGKFKYSDGVYQSAFAGYFPADNPRYSMIVVIKNKPRARDIYGGTVAAPVFREIADHLYKYIQQQPQPLQFKEEVDSLQYAIAGSQKAIQSIAGTFQMSLQDSSTGNWKKARVTHRQVITKPVLLTSSAVPDVRGMGLKDALHILETSGWKVSVVGKGKVVNQSIQAGLTAQKNQPIVLYLN
jgi:cell division protein FtsI (penicillin-binding protein 3)